MSNAISIGLMMDITQFLCGTSNVYSHDHIETKDVPKSDVDFSLKTRKKINS